MRSSINLATHPFVNYRRFMLTTGVLAVVVLGLTVGLAFEGVRVWQERTLAQARMRELGRQRAELAAEQLRLEKELQDPAMQEQLERVRFLNQLIQQKSLSWTELFFDLQQRLPARVRVLSLSPSLREDGRLQVEMRVGGQSAAAVIDFLRALEKGEEFHDIRLHSQSRDVGSATDSLIAEISATYVQK